MVPTITYVLFAILLVNSPAGALLITCSALLDVGEVNDSSYCRYHEYIFAKNLSQTPYNYYQMNRLSNLANDKIDFILDICLKLSLDN